MKPESMAVTTFPIPSTRHRGCVIQRPLIAEKFTTMLKSSATKRVRNVQFMKRCSTLPLALAVTESRIP